MTVLSSQIDTRSETFKRNAEAMRALVADLKARTAKCGRAPDSKSPLINRLTSPCRPVRSRNGSQRTSVVIVVPPWWFDRVSDSSIKVDNIISVYQCQVMGK